MDIQSDFDEIMKYAHLWNWIPDWGVFKDVYNAFPDSYSILIPFAYAYLEEIIRSTTSEYGIGILDEKGNAKKHCVGMHLIKLALRENSDNTDYVQQLNSLKLYFSQSSLHDRGNNRNSVMHGYMHPRFWTQESFKELIHKIASLSKYSKF